MRWPWRKTSNADGPSDWRDGLRRQAALLQVGGARPTGDPLASCFGEVRVQRKGASWPIRSGTPLWPLCQINLRDAPFCPDILGDLAMVQLFMAADWWSSDFTTMDSATEQPGGPVHLRAFASLEGLEPVTPPQTDSPWRPFEAFWGGAPVEDFPTHDLLPAGMSEHFADSYYEQDGLAFQHGSKIGGWPSCIQSEPWWEYSPKGAGFEFALQIASEPKAGMVWGDGGTLYLARNRAAPHLWAIEGQCF